MIQVYGNRALSSTNSRKAARFTIAAILACAGSSSLASGQCEIQFRNGHQVTVPTATTEAEQARGLSGRLDPSPGMVFTWPESASPAFWMKGTPSPLAVAFIEADGRVSSVQAMEPFSLTRHRPPAPIIAALELPAGGFRSAGLSTGDYVSAASCFELEGQP